MAGIEDYWHIHLSYRSGLNYGEIGPYYLDISEKGNYPFTLTNELPVATIDGKERVFSITILNYGLGLWDQYYTGNKQVEELLAVQNWLLENQLDDGSWLNDFQVFNFPERWTSGMGQGLAISFLIRSLVNDLIDKETGENAIRKALDFMLSDRLINQTACGRMIEKIEGQETNNLNGFVFALYGVLDYCIYTGDRTLFDEFEQTLRCMLPKYNFSGWSYYDQNRFISSRFYHRLHMAMMESLHAITGEEIYRNTLRKWKRGHAFFPVFVILKALEKVRDFRIMTTMDR